MTKKLSPAQLQFCETLKENGLDPKIYINASSAFKIAIRTHWQSKKFRDKHLDPLRLFAQGIEVNQ